jgi:SWI/SNF-related matrix-associated actin-dependent regulator of chromatin subfamily A3
VHRELATSLGHTLASRLIYVLESCPDLLHIFCTSSGVKMRPLPAWDDRKRGIQFIDLTEDDDQIVVPANKKGKHSTDGHFNSQTTDSSFTNPSSYGSAPSQSSIGYAPLQPSPGYALHAGSGHSSFQSSNGYTSSHPSTSYISSQSNPVVIGSSPISHASRMRRPVAIYIDDDDANSNDLDESLTQNFDAVDSNELYGSVDTEIVGCRFYNGHVTPMEMVLLRREPHNRYDSNAIQVLNVRNEQIGHIGKNLASKLAPFMDNHTLRVEGFTTGQKSYYSCPLAVRLFGPGDVAQSERVKQAMINAKIPLSGLKDLKARERDQARDKKDQAQRQKAEERERAKRMKGMHARSNTQGHGAGAEWDVSDSQFSSSWTPGSSGPSLEDIMKDSVRFDPRSVDEMVEKFGAMEDQLKDLELAPQPKAIRSQLLPYQRQGLFWMLQKEEPVLPELGSSSSVQLWKRVSANMVTNIATNFTLQNSEPALARGGILADDMGLGKTLQVISLIMESRKTLNCHSGSGATLIVSPLSVMSNWTGQIKHHVKQEHEPRVLVYHGSKRIELNPKTIRDWDVVVTTYDTIRSEHYGKDNKSKSGISSIDWRRIVLDEGHTIRNPAAKITNAICALQAHSRWVLTGTPIVNSLKDLYSMAKFLRIPGGFDAWEVFNRAIIRPVMSGFSEGGNMLQTLMRSICLRRKKDMKFIDLALPELSEYIHKIDFSAEEKKLYDSLHKQAQGQLMEYRQNQGNSGKGSLQAYQHLLEVLLRMRQMCNFWGLVGKDRFNALKAIENQDVVSLTPENRQALEIMLQLNIEAQEDCPICLETLNDPVITTCKHSFCSGCKLIFESLLLC